MRRIFNLGIVLLPLAAIVAFTPGARSAQAATASVSVKDNFFDQASITINVGDTVQWTWAGVNPHSVTANDASFDSNPPAGFQTSGTFSHTFNAAGAFQYFCRVHGAAMSGVVNVVEAATATAPAPTSTPVTPSPTAEPSATPSPQSTATIGAATSTPPAVTATAASAATNTPAATAAAAAAAGASLPRAGGGGGGDVSLPLGWIALASAGAGALVVAVAARVRRRPR